MTKETTKLMLMNTENIEAFRFYLTHHNNIDDVLAKDLLEEFEDCFEETSK